MRSSQAMPLVISYIAQVHPQARNDPVMVCCKSRVLEIRGFIHNTRTIQSDKTWQWIVVHFSCDNLLQTE